MLSRGNFSMLGKDIGIMVGHDGSVSWFMKRY